jgi:hypothetical protein
VKINSLVPVIVLLSLATSSSFANDSLETHRNFGIVVAYDGSSFPGFGGKVGLSESTSLIFMLALELSSRKADREIPGELGNQDLTSISFSAGLQHTFWQFDRLSLYGATAAKPKYKRIVWKADTGESGNTEIWRELFLYAGGGAEYHLSGQFTLSAQHLFVWTLGRYTFTYLGAKGREVNESNLAFGETTLILTFYF